MQNPMETLLKCAVVNDLSGFGRCSLTVAIPVISALGIQTCPVPTAILSNHTAYDDFYFEDYTSRIRAYYEKWEHLHLQFDSIYTGFLGSEAQIALISDFIARFQSAHTLLFVDPVMGDNGSMYATYTAEMCRGMRTLLARADVVTPNLTEACLLADVPYLDAVREEDADLIYQIADKILDLGAKCAIITGVRIGNAMHNFVRSRDGERFSLSAPFVAREYCGTGDLFASLLCGYLTLGMPHREALLKTQTFLSRALEFSAAHGVDPLDGLAFEPLLKEVLL